MCTVSITMSGTVYKSISRIMSSSITSTVSITMSGTKYSTVFSPCFQPHVQQHSAPLPPPLCHKDEHNKPKLLCMQSTLWPSWLKPALSIIIITSTITVGNNKCNSPCLVPVGNKCRVNEFMVRNQRFTDYLGVISYPHKLVNHR